MLDTVMISKSNHALLAPEAVAALRDELLPLADALTPNLPEAAALLDTASATDEDAMVRQGEALLALGARAVLMKGGHLDSADSPDWLVEEGGHAAARRRARAAEEHAWHRLHAVIGDCGADSATRQPRERRRRMPSAI